MPKSIDPEDVPVIGSKVGALGGTSSFGLLESHIMHDDPKELTAELNSSVHSTREVSAETIEPEDMMEKLGIKLSDLSTPCRNISGATKLPPGFAFEPQFKASGTLEYVPNDRTSRLEMSERDSENTLEITEPLSSMDNYDVQKEDYIKRTEEYLDAMWEEFAREDKVYRATQDAAKLPRRLIVSRVAAGAKEEDLRKLLSKFSSDIDEIRFLEGREPNRTRTAHIDMYTREAAKQASRFENYILGLMPEFKLAVEDAE